MTSIAVVAILSVLVWFVIVQTEKQTTPLSRKLSLRLEKLWDIAQSGMKEKKYLRAEKALLTILKLDQKNAPAYNRLGILYTKQKEYKDAIECFEIASSIEPSASSLHNLGLIYYETENYEKAASAFEHAISLEDNLAARHIAYAKVQEKLKNYDIVTQSLEKAVELEPTLQTYKLLESIYEQTGDTVSLKNIRARIKRATPESGRRRSIKRPRRIVF